MYSQTPGILKLSSSIYEKLGEIKARYPVVIHTNSQRSDRVDSICATMKLEGESLSRDKVFDLVKNRLIRGPQMLIQETVNLIDIYKNSRRIDPWTQDHFTRVHKKLMSKLPEKTVNYRNDVAAYFFRGREVIRMAPPPEVVPEKMNDLFHYLKHGEDSILLKSCLAHYIIESTQPFEYGNGKLGRFWQTILLMQEHLVFEFLPYENLLFQNRHTYFKALTSCNLAEDAAEFIIFILHIIDESLTEYINRIPRTVTASDRIVNFHHIGMQSFTRKDYMHIFKNISSATASRDLIKGVDAGLFERKGTKNATVYSCQKP